MALGHDKGFVALRIDGYEFVPDFVRFEHVESIHDGSRWRLVMDHPDWNYYAGFADGRKEEFHEFDYRFGMLSASEGATGGNENSVDWMPGVVLKTRQDYTIHGARTVIIGGDRALNLKSRTRTQPWRGDVYSIAAKIASDHNLVLEMEPEKVPSGSPLYWQYGENDWAFLRRQAQWLVSRRTGRGDYEVWVNGDTLHVRPPGGSGVSVKKWSIAGMGSALRSVRFIQRKKPLQMSGGLGVQIYGYDMESKEILSATKNYGNFPEKTRLAPKITFPKNSDIPGITLSVPCKYEDDIDAAATAFLGNRFRRMYILEAEIYPAFTGYNVGDVITVDLDQTGTSNPSSAFSGNYLLEQRKVSITLGGARMRILASRIGSQMGDWSMRGISMDSSPPTFPKNGRVRSVSPVDGV